MKNRPPVKNRTIAFALIVFVGSTFPACSRTVNDHLREAESGAPEAIEEAIDAIGELLARKERSKVSFDKGDLAAIEYLKDTAKSSRWRVHRAQAVAALGELQSIDATDVFSAGLADAFWLARLNAATAVRNHPSEVFVAGLQERLEKESRVEVRMEVVKALGVIGGDAALRSLFRVFLESRDSVDRNDERVHAFNALRRLTRLEHGFQDSTSWEAAYHARFPSSDADGAGAAAGASVAPPGDG